MAFTVTRKPTQGAAFTPQAYSNARVDPAAYGNGGAGLMAAGKVLGQAAQQVDAIYEKEANELAQAKIRESDTTFAGWKRDWINSAQDRKGKDATGLAQEFYLAAKAKAGEIRSTLPRRAQIEFDRLSSARISSGLDFTTGYERKQNEIYKDGQTDARIASLQIDAGRAWADQDAMQTNINGITSEVNAKGARKGWDKAEIDARQFEAKSVALSEAVIRAMETDPRQARQLLEKHKDEIDAKTATELDKRVTTAVSKVAASEAVDAAWTAADRQGGGGTAAPYAVRLNVAEGHIQNPRSTAVGTGQFLKKTWLDMVKIYRPAIAEGKTDAEILALRTSDPALAQEMVQALTAENQRALTGAGLPVNDSTLYLAHFLGASGAIRVLQADPDTPITEVTSKAAQDSNPEVFAQLSTAADMMAWAAKKIGVTPSAGGVTPDQTPQELAAGHPVSLNTRYVTAVEHVMANPDLDDAGRKRVLGNIEARYNAAKVANEAFYSDFRVALAQGELTADDIEQSYAEGKLTPEQRSAARRELITVEAKQAKAQAADKEVMAAFSQHRTIDLDDGENRKAIDRLYGGLVQRWVEGGANADAIVSRSVDFAKQMGTVPDVMQGQIKGWLRSSRPEDQKMGALLVSSLHTANPQLLADMSKEDIRRGVMIGEYISYGMTPDDAVARADRQLLQSEAAKEGAKARYAEVTSKKAGNLSSQAWLAKAFDTDEVAILPQMEGQFEQLVQEEFAAHGDLDLARKTALGVLKRSWSPSRLFEADGEVRLAQNAPEKLYGLPGKSDEENAEWMREQLLSDLSQNSMFEQSLDGRLSLIPSLRGERDQKGRTAYMVVLEGDGGPIIATDDKGAPLLWNPDPVEYQKKAAEDGRQAAPNNRQTVAGIFLGGGGDLPRSGEEKRQKGMGVEGVLLGGGR
jgi:hypothetical protein